MARGAWEGETRTGPGAVLINVADHLLDLLLLRLEAKGTHCDLELLGVNSACVGDERGGKVVVSSTADQKQIHDHNTVRKPRASGESRACEAGVPGRRRAATRRFSTPGPSLFFARCGTQRAETRASRQNAGSGLRGRGGCGHDAYLTHRYQKGRRLHGSPASAPPSAPACSPPWRVLLFHGETSGKEPRAGEIQNERRRRSGQEQVRLVRNVIKISGSIAATGVHKRTSVQKDRGAQEGATHGRRVQGERTIKWSGW